MIANTVGTEEAVVVTEAEVIEVGIADTAVLEVDAEDEEDVVI